MKNNIDIWLKKVIIGGIFILPFIPLIVSNFMFFPFITGKNLLFRLVVEIIVASWFILAVRNIEYRPKKSFLVWCVFAFVAVIGVADLFSPNIEKSFWSNFERMEGWITVAHLFGYFLVASSVLVKEKIWERLLQTSVGVSVFLSLYGISQLLGMVKINQGGTRLDGTLGNATYFAVYMLIHFFIAFFLLARHWKISWTRWFYGIAIFLQLFTLYHTATRGALVGLGVGLIITAILSIIFAKDNKFVKKISVVLLVIVFFGSAFLYFARNIDWVKKNPVLSRFSSISLKEGSARFMVWNMAFQGFKERPILGWGQESFNYVFNKYYDPKMYMQEQWFDRAHNVFLDWLIAGGILGLLAYLSLYFVSIYLLWKKTTGLSSFEKSILTGLLSAHFIQNFFVFDNITSYILFFMVLAYIQNACSSEKENRFFEKNNPNDYFKNLINAGTVIVFIFVVYFSVVKFAFAGNYLIHALTPQKEGIPKNIEYFTKALSYGTSGNSEIREQIIQIASQISREEKIPMEIKQKLYNFANAEIDKEIDGRPYNARTLIFKGMLLEKYGDFTNAVDYLKKALVSSPKKQTIMFELGSVYINISQFKDAFQLFKQAYELEPSYVDARTLYALSAIYVGDMNLANSLLAKQEDGRGEIIPDQRFINAYLLRGDIGKIIEIWKAKIVTEPNNVSYRLALGATYLKNGERNMAIKILEEAKKIDPAQATQIDYYINEIKAGRNP